MEDCSDISGNAPVIGLPLSTRTDPKPYPLSDHDGYHNPFQLALPHIAAFFHASAAADRHIYRKTKPDIHCYAGTASRDPTTNANTDHITHFRPHWLASTRSLRFADGI
jgi:hypothetical protein